MPSCLFSASAKSTCIPEKDVVPSWRPVSKACGRAFSEGSAPISNIGAFVFCPTFIDRTVSRVWLVALMGRSQF